MTYREVGVNKSEAGRGAIVRDDCPLLFMVEDNFAWHQILVNLPLETQELIEVLQDMVRNNILCFDFTEATYCPGGKNYEWGIRLCLNDE